MIVSHINNSDKYFCLHRHLKEAFAFLRTLDKSTKPQSFSFDGFSGSIVAVKTDKSKKNRNWKRIANIWTFTMCSAEKKASAMQM